MNFIAIDVETANSDYASICQIGLVKVINGALSNKNEWEKLVDPEDSFDPYNISIHGIDESVVRGKPTFPEIIDTLWRNLEGTVVVCHTPFDRIAIRQASKKYHVNAPECTWLDTACVARRVWNDCAWKGYGLYDVCKMLGYDFKHHDALEDAKAAAHILLAAMNETGLDLEGLLRRVKQPIDLNLDRSASPIRYEENSEGKGNPEDVLYGESLVFTGALKIKRQEAVCLAASIGCQVKERVTKKTTMLVVGDQDIRRLAGHEKSSNHRKAEELIAKGFPIRVMKESDFIELLMCNNPSAVQFLSR